MGMHGHRDLLGRALHQAGEGRLRQQVAGVGPDDMRPEQFTGTGIGDEFRKTIHFTDDRRLAEGAEGKLPTLTLRPAATASALRPTLAISGRQKVTRGMRSIRIGWTSRPAIVSTATIASWLATWARA